ncbi:MAG: cell wall-binding protein, partial [Clostridium sp.]
MNNLGKRFMALFIAFVSIISYLPLQLIMNEQAVNAATIYNIPEQYLKVQVNDSSKKTLPEAVDELDGYPYFDSSQGGSYFDITIKNYTEDIDKKLENIKNNATDNIEGEITSITGLDIVVTSLNNIDLTKPSGNMALQELGITIKDTPTNTISGRGGVRIENPPLGVDKVQYRIEGTVTRTKYKVTVADNGRKAVERISDTIDSEKYIAKNEENIIINNGTDFVGNNVELTFEQYIGTGNTSETNLDAFLDSENSKYNNKAPFLYTAEAESDEKVKLRYTWGVPDSLSALYYKMRFKGVELGHSDTIVYVNGEKGNATNTSNDTIKGYLGSISSKDQFVVIKINGTENNTSMTKLYSAELRYSQKNRENDYSIQEAGIYKADYAEDPEVKAYIGKRFTEKIVKDEEGNVYSEYKGTITIDPKARMINLTPKLVRNGSTIRYELWNNYTKDGISKSIKAYE